MVKIDNSTKAILETSLLPIDQIILRRDVARNALTSEPHVLIIAKETFKQKGINLTLEEVTAIYQRELFIYQSALDMFSFIS